MQPSHLPFAWLRIIEHFIFQLLDSLLRRLLALNRELSALLLGRRSFFQATLKAFRLNKLFNRNIYTAQKIDSSASRSLLASRNPVQTGQSLYIKHMCCLSIFYQIACSVGL